MKMLVPLGVSNVFGADTDGTSSQPKKGLNPALGPHDAEAEGRERTGEAGKYRETRRGESGSRSPARGCPSSSASVDDEWKDEGDAVGLPEMLDAELVWLVIVMVGR
jgi:hypothetical protein